MSSPRIIPLILAGGGGTRLWPLSRGDEPKQFLSLFGGDTLIQGTARRLLSLAPPAGIYVVAAPRWRGKTRDQLAPLGWPDNNFIAEPEPRGTAPAIALAAASLLRRGSSLSDVMLVCPSDHLIADEAAFRRASLDAASAAAGGSIAIFGIKPISPETGFGYIKAEPADGEATALAVERFVEKPDAATAARFIADGGYYWNGGYFCMTLGAAREAFEHHLPEAAPIFSPDAAEAEAAFLSCQRVSFDKAVMERASGVLCVPLDAGWSDVGSWSAVLERSPRDAYGCAAIGGAEFLDARGTLVCSTTGRRVVCVNTEGLIVVDTPDALLVMPAASSQRVSEVQQMR